MNIKIKKGQKCWKCKKEIQGEWAYNGHYWHTKCKDKDTQNRIKKLINNKKNMEIKLKYKFQLDSSESEIQALLSLIRDGWIIDGYIQEDGYSWLILLKDN